MKTKEGLGWRAGYDEKTGRGGAEIFGMGDSDLYEISRDVFSRLDRNADPASCRELIRSGRHLYMKVNDRCGPPYTVVLDEDYALYCPWKQAAKPAGEEWGAELTDAAVELFESEKDNREQRRKKRAGRKKQ